MQLLQDWDYYFVLVRYMDDRKRGFQITYEQVIGKYTDREKFA